MLWLCLLSDSLARLLLFGCLAFQHFLHGQILDVQYMYSFPLSVDTRLLMLWRVKEWSTLREAQTSTASEPFTDVWEEGCMPSSPEELPLCLVELTHLSCVLHYSWWRNRGEERPCAESRDRLCKLIAKRLCLLCHWGVWKDYFVLTRRSRTCLQHRVVVRIQKIVTGHLETDTVSYTRQCQFFKMKQIGIPRRLQRMGGRVAWQLLDSHIYTQGHTTFTRHARSIKVQGRARTVRPHAVSLKATHGLEYWPAFNPGWRVTQSPCQRSTGKKKNTRDHFSGW